MIQSKTPTVFKKEWCFHPSNHRNLEALKEESFKTMMLSQGATAIDTTNIIQSKKIMSSQT